MMSLNAPPQTGMIYLASGRGVEIVAVADSGAAWPADTVLEWQGVAGQMAPRFDGSTARWSLTSAEVEPLLGCRHARILVGDGMPAVVARVSADFAWQGRQQSSGSIAAVIGSPGVSVVGASITDGHLVVSLSDGATIDAGAVSADMSAYYTSAEVDEAQATTAAALQAQITGHTQASDPHPQYLQAGDLAGAVIFVDSLAEVPAGTPADVLVVVR